MDMKFEVVVLPVSDVDRAKCFYQALGWRLDNELAVCENAARIERFEAQGFVRCSYEALREVWRKQNTQAFKRLHAAARTAASHKTDCG